jgi:rubrerythrin
MNIFDQAMDIEKEGEALYRQFSLGASDEGMKHVFAWLADQERKHYEIFQKMKVGKSARVEESSILHDVKDIFSGWKDIAGNIGVKVAEVDLYRRALDSENKNVLVYENYANASATGQQKDIFLAIAKEEKKHQWILRNIIEFVAKPEVWAENAEFDHLEEDYYL